MPSELSKTRRNLIADAARDIVIIAEDEIDLLFDGFAKALDDGPDHAFRGGWL